MGYTRHYAGYATDAEADAAAVNDTKEYLGEERSTLIIQHLMACTTGEQINEVNIALAMCGVQGRPFHAICRTYALAAYREWMHSGDNPVMTDEEGFTLTA